MVKTAGRNFKNNQLTISQILILFSLKRFLLICMKVVVGGISLVCCFFTNFYALVLILKPLFKDSILQSANIIMFSSFICFLTEIIKNQWIDLEVSIIAIVVGLSLFLLLINVFSNKKSTVHLYFENGLSYTPFWLLEKYLKNIKEQFKRLTVSIHVSAILICILVLSFHIYLTYLSGTV